MPFSGVTSSGRVWRKVPESDALEEGAGKRYWECDRGHHKPFSRLNVAAYRLLDGSVSKRRVKQRSKDVTNTTAEIQTHFLKRLKRTLYLLRQNTVGELSK